MARRIVKATLDDYARAVVIVYEALHRAQQVCGWARRDSLFVSAESLNANKVKVVDE